MELTLEDISKRLTLDIINRTFKEKTKSMDRIKSINVTKAGAGEGMISAVYRIQVSGTSHEASFVAKGQISNLLLRKSIRLCDVAFQREVLFFTEILPQFKELQESLGSKENIQRNIPICYSCYAGDGDDYLLLEDLSESFCDSVAVPTKSNRDLTLQVLAHFHAMSLALKAHKPEVFLTLANKIKEECYFNENNREWYAKYLKNAIEIDKQVIKEYENVSSDYYKKFIDIVSSDVFGQLVYLVSNPGDHPAMNHGDAWLPNFMYSKERTVVIDFQGMRYSSPVTDLTYYLALCSNLCSGKEDFYESLNIYYSFLQYYLADMDLDSSKIFSREDLDKELRTYGKFGLLAVLTTIPLLASDRANVGQSLKDHEGADTIPLEDLWKLTPIKDPVLKTNLVNVVRIAVDVGLI